MREGWTSSELIRSGSRGLAQGSSSGSSRYGSRPTSVLAMKAMKLKLSGQISREVSERRQVGDAEEMFAVKGGERPWWRSVGMDEGV
jgi:pyruvate dehydrogenase kinase 2/3/4